MTSTLLDRFLGPDPMDPDEPTGDAWYLPVHATEWRTDETGRAEHDRCWRRHSLALKARYHGKTDGRIAMASHVDPMREVEELPIPLPPDRLKLLALGLLWSMIVALAGVLIGQTVVVVAAGLAVVSFGWVAAVNAGLAWKIWRNGGLEVRR